MSRQVPPTLNGHTVEVSFTGAMGGICCAKPMAELLYLLRHWAVSIPRQSTFLVQLTDPPTRWWNAPFPMLEQDPVLFLEASMLRPVAGTEHASPSRGDSENDVATLLCCSVVSKARASALAIAAL